LPGSGSINVFALTINDLFVIYACHAGQVMAKLAAASAGGRGL